MPLAVHAGSPFHTFAGPFGEVRLRVHAAGQQHTQEQALGGLIVFHDASSEDTFEVAEQRHAALANAGACTVLAVDSALIREPKFPQSVDEAYFIACFLHEHVDELGLDHRRIGIGGEGFGATLATAASRLAKERRNPELVFQLLLWPLLDLRAPETKRAVFAQRYLRTEQDAVDPRASPIVAKNLIGLPPALIVSHADSVAKADAETYLAALKRAFVASTLAVAADFPSALPTCGSALRTALGQSRS